MKQAAPFSNLDIQNRSQSSMNRECGVAHFRHQKSPSAAPMSPGALIDEAQEGGATLNPN